MSNCVHFVDTSILVELLDIPNMTKHHDEIKAEYEELAKNGDTFILPVSVLVETGNHIAHSPSRRYELGEKFKALILGKNQFEVLPTISKEALERILSDFPKQASGETGFGDISIVAQFEEYWHTKQPIGHIRIWSLDKHLASYQYEGGLARRRDK